jgi:O-antigen ligase
MNATTLTMPNAETRPWLDRLTMALLLAFVATVQISIVAAQAFLVLLLVAWIATLVRDRVRPTAPQFFLLLLGYAAITLVSSAFSIDPIESFIDSRQLYLFLIVPVVYDLARGARTKTVMDVIITVGALAAAYGIIQYGMLHFDSLRLRPRGTMGHYMTYSGTLMLVIGVAAARIVFGVRDRIWPALVMPALIVALTLTFTRSAWVGVCVGVSLLFILKDFRLTGLIPVIIALLFALAPDRITDRIMSVFDLRDPTSRDRVAMLQTGGAMIKDHPLTGVGPNMVERSYTQYRDPAPAQRADSDRRRARSAGIGPLDRFRRRSSRGRLPDLPRQPGSRARRRRACRDRGDAVRGHVRVQLRRLGIPDAVPRDRHVAVCRGAARPPCCCQPSRLIGRGGSSAPPAAPACSSSATPCSTSSSSDA